MIVNRWCHFTRGILHWDIALVWVKLFSTTYGNFTKKKTFVINFIDSWGLHIFCSCSLFGLQLQNQQQIELMQSKSENKIKWERSSEIWGMLNAWKCKWVFFDVLSYASSIFPFYISLLSEQAVSARWQKNQGLFPVFWHEIRGFSFLVRGT